MGNQNMEKIVDYLKQLDLSDVEAKLYLTLLQTGSASVRDLAATIDIKRTTAYFYIDQLIDKGLIMKLVKGSKKLVAANEPENLKHLVEEKLTFAKSIQQDLPDILQKLSKISPEKNETKEVEIRSYKGALNAQKIYAEALKANEVRSYARVYQKKEQLFPNNNEFFINAFKKNKKLKMWEIIYDSDSTLEPAEEITASTDRYLYMYMPKHLKLSSEDILIYDDRVAIINYRGNNTSIVLHSKDFYNNLKELFDFVWEVLSERK